MDILEKFLSPRGGSNAWARRPDVIAAWRGRAQLEVPPMTMEYAPILACDAACPTCPYGRVRREFAPGVVAADTLAPEDDVHAATWPTARRVLEQARSGGVQGVLFTGGGEPMLFGPLLDALRYSYALGMVNCLYTNGFRLGREPDLAPRLVAPEHGLVFVRLSINAVSPNVIERHWNVPASLVLSQLDGLAALLRAREDLARRADAPVALPSIQVSTIIDHRNVDDLQGICARVAAIFGEYPGRRGAEDVMIVRPLTVHGRHRFQTRDHPDSVIARILEVCGHRGRGRGQLAEAGIDLFLGFGLSAVDRGEASSYPDLLANEYARRTISWANGVFLTVGPDGSAHLSTEHNCDPRFAIGNLTRQSVAEIYASSRRRELIVRANALRWGPEIAQPTARTARLDRIAEAIINGELTDAHVEAIGLTSLRSHALLLD